MTQQYYNKLYRELSGETHWYQRKKITGAITQAKITPREGYQMIKQLANDEISRITGALEHLVEQPITRHLKPSQN